MLTITLLFFSCVRLFSQVLAWEGPEKPGKWYKLISGYFIIWYEEKDEHTAIQLAAAGNEFYYDFKDVFGDKSPRKVYVRIHSRTGIANGSYQTAPPVINFYTQSFPVATKGFDWNYYLLVHEFVHYIHLEYKGGLPNVLYYFFGPMGRMYPLYFTPYWQIEGLATAIESDFTSSGRYHNPFFTMPYRADILLDSVETYDQMSLNFGDDESANFARKYQYGVQLMYSIKEDYGYEKLVEVWQNFIKFPLGYRQRHKKVFGEEMSELYQNMIDKSKKKYSQFKNWNRGKELPLRTNTRARYTLLGNSDKGILYSSQGTDVRATYNLIDPSTNKITELISSRAPLTDIFNSQPADISTDAKLLIYIKPTANTDLVGSTGFEPIGYYNDLYMYHIDSRKEERITNAQQLFAPVLSSDKRFVFVSQFTDSGNSSRLIKIDLNAYSSGYEVVYERSQSSIVYKTLSPDSNSILFLERSPEFGVKLQLLDLRTKKITSLISRDYGLEIHSPRFINNDTISIVSDIEYSTLTTAYYELDISELNSRDSVQEPRIRINKIARDMVGIDTAVKDSKGRLWYVSHNGKAYSIYSYVQEELEQKSMDINMLQGSDYFQEGGQLTHVPKSLSEESSFISVTDARHDAYTITRSYGAIPYRPVYWMPYVYFRKSNSDLRYFNLGELSFRAKFESPNGRSNMLTSFNCYYRDTFSTLCATTTTQDNIGFDFNYTYAFPRLGNIALFVNRYRNLPLASQGLNNVLQHQFSFGLAYGRILTMSPNNYFILFGTYTKMMYNNYEVLTNSLREKDSVLSTSIELPFGWTSQAYTNTKNTIPLSWRFSPSVTYNFILSVNDENDAFTTLNKNWGDNMYVSNIAYLNIPILTQFGVKLSNYSAWNNKGFILSNRFTRYQQEYFQYTLLGNESSVKLLSLDGLSVLKTFPFQSSYALDLILKSNVRVGGNLMEIYQFYLNTFVSQNTFYNRDDNTYKLADYLVLGAETGFKLRIAFVPITINIGLGYKIPYNRAQSSDYFVYIGAGTHNMIDEHGVE